MEMVKGKGKGKEVLIFKAVLIFYSWIYVNILADI